MGGGWYRTFARALDGDVHSHPAREDGGLGWGGVGWYNILSRTHWTVREDGVRWWGGVGW